MNRAYRALSVAVALVLAVGAIGAEVHAEEPAGTIVLAQAERPGIFRFLFRERGRPRYVPPEAVPRQRAAPRQPAAPRQQARPRRQREAAPAKPRKKRAARSAAAPAAPREVAAIEKAPDAKRVLVIGDFMAGALAKGLADTYAENPNVVVVDASSGSSGLVRQDYYDWPKELPGIVAEQKPDAVLALLGANDRQGISTATGPHVLGSDGWRVAYGGRVAALADALKATGKPVLWVGLAPVRSSAMSRDYSTFNGIVREQLEGKGIRFIEVWNGFANEEGKFVSSGPDVTGQAAQLRDSDGLNFTRAGQRKLAYFVEQELNALIGGAAPILASTGGAAGTGVAPPMAIPPAAAGPKIGPMVPLEALTAGGAALSGVMATPAAASGDVTAAIAKRLAGEDDAKPPAGRADNFSWPEPEPATPAPQPAAPTPAPQAAAQTLSSPAAAPAPQAAIPASAPQAAAAPPATP